MFGVFGGGDEGCRRFMSVGPAGKPTSARRTSARYRRSGVEKKGVTQADIDRLMEQFISMEWMFKDLITRIKIYR